MKDDRFTDRVAALFADAIADVRRRVVVEPWFGQPLDGSEAEPGRWSAPVGSPLRGVQEADIYSVSALRQDASVTAGAEASQSDAQQRERRIGI